MKRLLEQNVARRCGWASHLDRDDSDAELPFGGMDKCDKWPFGCNQHNLHSRVQRIRLYVQQKRGIVLEAKRTSHVAYLTFIHQSSAIFYEVSRTNVYAWFTIYRAVSTAPILWLSTIKNSHPCLSCRLTGTYMVAFVWILPLQCNITRASQFCFTDCFFTIFSHKQVKICRIKCHHTIHR